MIELTGKEIYLACGFTDMRKSINGLSSIVEQDFELTACEERIFVFCSRKRDLIKILEWCKDGFWLYTKRLELGKFKWPEVSEDEATMNLDEDELKSLLLGPGLEQKLKRKKIDLKTVY